MPDALFVYGSLRSEFDNPHVRLLREKAESLGRATVRGSIFLIRKYPGYRTEPDGIVQGELWRLHDPEATLAALDEYEGDAYSRIAVTLLTPPATAWIYIYKGDVQPDRRIVSGDFLDR
jgi:gamma-glutamylcyclotransferase (GGCT)/AIG2-like uncharacterized protein YtfP